MPIAFRALRRCLLLLSVSTAAIAAPANMPPSGPVPPADNQKLAHDIFRDIVEVRSVHDIGTGEVANILVKYLKAGGFANSEINVVPETKYPKQVNVVVRIKGKGHGKPVMWICHMDVVDARKEDWTPGLDPYKFTEKDGYWYGRGTSDMKDEDAAAAASLIRLKKEGSCPIATSSSRSPRMRKWVSSRTARSFSLRDKRPLVDAGLVMNPDGGSGEILNGKRLDFAVETVQKTYMTFRMETTNKGGHSSEPRPDNAIYELADGLTKLATYVFPTRTTPPRAPISEPSREHGDRAERERPSGGIRRMPMDQAAAARLAKDIPLERHPAHHLRRHHAEGRRAGECAAQQRRRHDPVPRVSGRERRADARHARQSGCRS